MAGENNDSLADIFSQGSDEQSSSTEAKGETSESASGTTEEKPSPTDEKPADGNTEEVETKTDATSDEEKSESEEKKSGEEKAGDKEKVDGKDKWDSDDNPYLKRYKDTHTEWNRTHQQNLQLQTALAEQARQIEILKRKADGTWTEEDEAASTPSHEEVANRAVYVGKAMASRNAAYREFGEERVNTELTRFNKLFANHKFVQAQVENSDSPVHAALDILERYDFEVKYGSSPKQIRDALTKEIDAELRKKIKEETAQELLKAKKLKDETPTDHSTVRGSAKSSGVKEGDSRDSLQSIFDH